MKKGVTLIELMVAIVILGIIAGAVADRLRMKFGKRLRIAPNTRPGTWNWKRSSV